ncbi:MAG: 50S ribosomal protein L35 [Actinobacteria bacterium]|jgi:large subunit ribosomal protein L35|nr:50S ribosomal protein L35 [Actinomycetota bacterium]MBU1494231.1 50S ribosomal protein L35 [Actinomycetota bacterium]
MPKMKTRRSVAKRFKTSGTGKLRREQAGRKHMKAEKKPGTRLRRLAGTTDVAPGDGKRIRKMLNG